MITYLLPRRLPARPLRPLHLAARSAGALRWPNSPCSELRRVPPFVRRLPEFQFWPATTTALCIATLLTCFKIFNVPVLWPILLVYWIFLCTLTLRKQIQRIIKYNYVPFTFGKKRYDRNRESSGKVRGRESLLP